jgi:hypothetical protein
MAGQGLKPRYIVLDGDFFRSKAREGLAAFLAPVTIAVTAAVAGRRKPGPDKAT